MQSMHSGKTASMAGAMEAGKCMGEWTVLKILGKGSYGTVGLLQNSKTKAQIALKKYEVSSTSSGSHEAKRLRNNAEVQRMYKKVDHPHIVSTQAVPEAVREYFGCSEIEHEDQLARDDETEAGIMRPTMPLLAMEYCRGGDLRQMLRRPENVNGLSERNVRLVLLHISEAISYLHDNRMVHRDIKPENIVIQYRGTNEPAVYKLGDLGSALDSFEKKALVGIQDVPTKSEAVRQATYKLADLGFAKDLPPTGSTCSTQLGTMPYLAPEICRENKYGRLVDYWSFGVVTFEIICGRHPFLGEPPEVWLPRIQQQRIRGQSTDKRPTVIGLEEIQEDGKIIRRTISKFPCPTRLSHILRECLEAWLPSMLEIDPTRRGKFNKKEDSNALTRLRKIIRAPVVRVRYFPRSWAYIVSLETKVTTIKAQIKIDLDIPETEQVILAPCGLLLGDGDLVHKYSETVGLYLLRRNESFSTNFTMPTSLVIFLNGDEWKATRCPVENQKLFADAIRFFQTEIERVETLVGCCKAMLLHHQKACVDVATEFNDAWNRLQAAIEIEEGKLLMEASYPIPQAPSSTSVNAIKTDADKIFQSSKVTLLKCQAKIPLKTFPVRSLVLWYEKAMQIYQEFRGKRAPGSAMGSIPYLATAICKFGEIRTSIVEDANWIMHCIVERIGADKRLIIQLQTSVKKLNDLREHLTKERLERDQRILEMAFSRYPQHVPSPRPAVVTAEMQRAANPGFRGQKKDEKTRDKPTAVLETNLASQYPQTSSNTSSSPSAWDDVFKVGATSHPKSTPRTVSSPSSNDVLKGDAASPHPQPSNNTGSPPTHLDVMKKVLGANKAHNELWETLVYFAENQLLAPVQP